MMSKVRKSGVNTMTSISMPREEFQFLVACQLVKKCLNQSGLTLKKFGNSIAAKKFNKVTLFARSNAIGCIILIGGRGGRRIIAYICFISVQ